MTCLRFLSSAFVLAICLPAVSSVPLTGGSGAEKADHRLESRRHEGIPSVAVDPKSGRLWCTWYGGITPNEDCNNYLVLSTSIDGGRTWKEVLHYDPDGAGRLRAFDCELWVAPDGTLRWFWTERRVLLRDEPTPDGKPSDAGWWAGHSDSAAIRTDRLMMMTLAADREPVAPFPVPVEVTRGVMMCKPIVAKNGDWVLPVSRWFEDNSAGLVFSSDGGRTFAWHGGADSPNPGRTFDEHCVVEMPDGGFRIWLRNNRSPMESTTADAGRTWSATTNANFKGPATRIVVRRLKSGRILLVGHGAIDENPGRSKLTAFLSEDDGASWKGGLLLDERENSSYPDADEDPDGTIYVVWDNDRCVRREIRCARFTEADVLAGKMVKEKSETGLQVSVAPEGTYTVFNPLPAGSVTARGKLAECVSAACSCDWLPSVVRRLMRKGDVSAGETLEAAIQGGEKLSPDAVNSLWMATPEGGLAAIAYAPCVVRAKTNAGETEIETLMDVPRKGDITLRFVKGTGYFPVVTRMPSWCDHPRAGQFVKHARNWKPGMEIRLRVCPRKTPVDYVDPMIGTGSKRADEGNAGGMMPYTGVPFGMWQWVPMTRLSEHGITSFSAYEKDFRGFIATRQPAPWMGEFGQISLMAQTGAVANCDYGTRGVEMEKGRCVFTPYYAKVVTKDGVVSEVTASSRAAILRFTFPKGAKRRLVFDASRFFMSCFACDRPQVGGIRFGSWWNDRRITAFNSDRCDMVDTPELKNFAAHFTIELSEPFVATGTYVGGKEHGKRPAPGRAIPWNAYPKVAQFPGEREAEGDLVGGWCEFADGDEPVCVRIGNSFISESKADDNLAREAGDGFDFEAMKASARVAWKAKLATMRIDASDEIKTIFYTAMYHAMLFPREIDEYGEYYSGFDDAVHKGGASYTCYSMWDTYRSEHAFLALAAPERVDGMMRSILQNYKEGGWLPKWPNLTYTGQMMGDPASMILAEAHVKGFRGFDVNLAFEAAWKSATVPAHNDLGNNWKGRIPWRGYPCVRCGLTRYMENGWVAADECFESVTRTQDFGLDDLAVAVLADATGHEEEASYLRKRSRNYRNVWNRDKKLFWPRYASGRWKPFWNGEMGHGDYTEAIPETSVWNVAYDLDGLVELLGGRAAAVRALDEFYAKYFYDPKRPEFSLHENEPTHHISYIYNRLGEHEKCARTVRRILAQAYTTESWGFEGNDDCGQMSSWYILSALGIYPSLTYTEWYEIGSPLVDRAEIRIGAPFKPATFTIVAKNQSGENCIVKSVKLNGAELKDRRIRHSDIVRGGALEFEMSDR